MPKIHHNIHLNVRFPAIVLHHALTNISEDSNYTADIIRNALQGADPFGEVETEITLCDLQVIYKALRYQRELMNLRLAVPYSAIAYRRFADQAIKHCGDHTLLTEYSAEQCRELRREVDDILHNADHDWRDNRDIGRLIHVLRNAASEHIGKATDFADEIAHLGINPNSK